MNELIDFLVEITENSQRGIERNEWEVLRDLTETEIQQLWEIDEAWGELEVLKAEVQCALSEDRRAEIRSRHDLSDEELELLGRLMLARDVYMATQNAFWPPIKYELRHFEQLMLDSDRAKVLGRGNNRKSFPGALEPVGSPNADEIVRLTRLFGE